MLQKRQNELAKKNALQRYASEQLKIRQLLNNLQKGFEASLKARKARAEFEANSRFRYCNIRFY